jgi:hypothetical protein
MILQGKNMLLIIRMKKMELADKSISAKIVAIQLMNRMLNLKKKNDFVHQSVLKSIFSFIY